MSGELTFSIGPDGDVTVQSYEELGRWLEKERSRWAWMVPTSGGTDRHGLATELQNVWNGLIGSVDSCRVQGQPLEAARQYLQPLATGFIMVSTTKDGATVLDIRESAGDVAAMAAFGFLKQRLTPQSASLRDEFLGLVLSVLPDLRDPSDWTERLKRERANFRMATRSLTERVNAEAAERDRQALELANRARGIAARIFNMRRAAWRTAQAEWEGSATALTAQIGGQVADSIASITSAEAAYREFMKLKAPVEYWQNKAKDHRDREARARKTLYWYFPVTTVVLSGAFISSGWFLLSHPDTQSSKAPVALYVVVSGGLLLISTLAFWIGRLFTKLYLSEHHLRNDAEERATMTTTYLALTSENAAADSDRQIILNALFRATPDGIVKEDGPSDIGLQGILSKLLAK